MSRSNSSSEYVLEITTRCPSFLRILAHRTAVTRLPERDSGNAGVTIPIFIQMDRKRQQCIQNSDGAGPKPGPHIAAVGSIEVTISITNHSRPRRPTATSQDLVISE